ncbi:MAG: NAD(P)/FAD-dependent oxidoreductase [Solirubrobacteraceae bacterium]|nr:NAD(P)/FAD-dependent oxidoreductase [Solirubrobacteraceae bacterium]
MAPSPLQPDPELEAILDPLQGLDPARLTPSGLIPEGEDPRRRGGGEDGDEGKLPKQVKVAIIGAGFGGVDAAIQLMNAGETDFVVVDRAEGPSGCWRANHYPGIACDVPSNLYSYSYAPNPNWTRTYSPGGEIADYIERVARDYGVIKKTHFGVTVQSARWLESDQQWELQTDAGVLRSQFLISALGPLTEPVFPDIKGRESFTGPQMHSARWDDSVDLTGKRVAAIGTGASAIQFVPKVAKEALELDVYQRTAPWVLPRTDRDTTRLERMLFRNFPITQRLSREATYWAREILVAGMRGSKLVRGTLEFLGRRHLQRQVKDPVLRERLKPNFDIGCKRILLSNTWYPALTQPNVHLVTDAIQEITPTGIRTTDGKLREVDAILYGTGFHVTDPPAAEVIYGRSGETLAGHWNGSPKCYLGSTIDGFPNLFMVVGPGSGVGHTSILLGIEWQVSYAVQAITRARNEGISTYCLKAETMDQWVRDVDALSEGTVWVDGGCKSYYVDATGRNSTTWPTYTFKLRDRLKAFDPSEYEVARVTAPAAAPR